MPIKCPHCGANLSSDEVSALISQAVDEGLAPSFAGRRKGSRNSRPRSDIGKSHKPPVERKPETESELKKRTSAENGRKGGRPKGSPNKAPRADKGLQRGSRDANR